jgi:sporulation protein YlmC with PRC-barrel domain
MKSTILSAALIALLSTAALAQPVGTGRVQLMSTVPGNTKTVTDWYKQDVYDPNQNKIGQIMDVLVSAEGHVNALIVGVGGFLGAGEKDVAVGFDAVKPTNKNSKVYLTMDTTKDALRSAPGFKYDSNTTTWIPDKSSNNTQ